MRLSPSCCSVGVSSEALVFTLVFSGLVECGSVVGFEDSAETPNPKFWQVHFPLEWDGCVNLRDWTGGGPRSCIQAVFRMGTRAPLGQDTESLAADVNELMAVKQPNKLK